MRSALYSGHWIGERKARQLIAILDWNPVFTFRQEQPLGKWDKLLTWGAHDTAKTVTMQVPADWVLPSHKGERRD